MTTSSELIRGRSAAVDRWYDTAARALMAKHEAADLWGVPKAARDELFHEYAARLREAWFRDPVTGEPTAERRSLERADYRATIAEAAEVLPTASGRTSGAGPAVGARRPAPDDLLAGVG